MQNFSVVNTRIKLIEINNIKFIEKQIKLNVSLPCDLETVKGYIDKYLLSLFSAGLPMPSVQDSWIEGERITYRCKYRGQNIIERYRSPQYFLYHCEQELREILKIIKMAQDYNIYIDPHPKNFVHDGEEIFFVDFSPPYMEEYIDLRLSIVTPEERPIVEKNFSYFAPEHLGYHFAGDFLNIDVNFSTCFDDLYPHILEEGLINTTCEEFKRRAKNIRALEDLRLSKDIFLM